MTTPGIVVAPARAAPGAGRSGPAPRRPHAAASLLAAAILALPVAAARGGDLADMWRGLTAPARALPRKAPPTCGEECVERLGKEIDWLEHHIDRFGSIVAKQPDVWGQSRLTRYRYEYETLLEKELGNFQDRANASLMRSDQSFVGVAMALAAGRQSPTTPQPAVQNVQNLISDPTQASSGVIDRSPPFAAPQDPFAKFGLADDNAVSLEPNVHLDHLSGYIAHLQELRRINEGDDGVDSPGYALNLVRVPVSILPGKVTQQGYGAEITITADADLRPDLLPVTFRSLVVNDLVDLLAPPLTFACNSGAARSALCRGLAVEELRALGGDAADTLGEERRDGTLERVRRVLRTHAMSVSVPSAKMRRARMPLPPEQVVDVFGMVQSALLVRAAIDSLGGHPANRPCIDYMDVRGFLAEELEAAYDFLAQDRQASAWARMGEWNLAETIRSHRFGELELRRREFFESLGIDETVPGEPLAHAPTPAAPCRGPCGNAVDGCRLCRTTTAVLAWAVLVESALLNDRLVEDMRSTGGMSAAACALAGPFWGPDPAPEARDAFNDYVRRRWPIRVFALDPVTQEQNVEDMYSQRREMQMAMALASAGGRFNGSAMTRYARRLQTDLATIGLNKTAVGFTHGADTFGWRFYPRVQSPATKGNLQTFAETICGTGDSRRAVLSQRCLEPGMRECTAMIVMPSFVPTLTLDVSTHWFALANPGRTEQGMRETLKLSRSVKSMQVSAAACADCAGAYRDGEVARLLRRVDQLERQLPLQTLEAQIPYENTSGGFELFDTGVTDLAPELIGYYGAEGIDPGGTTSLFLIGKGFSIHDTNVIAGGRPVKATLISRDVIRAEVPPGVQIIRPDAAPVAPAVARILERDGRLIAGRGAPAAAPLEAPRVAVPAGRTTLGRRSVVLAGQTEEIPRPGPAAGSRVIRLPSALVPERDPAPKLDFAERLGAPDATCPDDREACASCCTPVGFVDIHLATPYGVSDHLLVPVYQATPAPAAPAPVAGDCELSFTPDTTIDLTTARTKSGGWRVSEYFTSNPDRILVEAPPHFAAPERAELRCTLRDDETGGTVATFAVAAPPFVAARSAYVLAAGDLRNFIGDTSRPATDKTLRGALKPYIDHLGAGLTEGTDPDVERTFTLTAELASGQQLIPVRGSVAVRVHPLRGTAPAADDPDEPRQTR